jgi:hypothetical protein
MPPQAGFPTKNCPIKVTKKRSPNMTFSRFHSRILLLLPGPLFNMTLLLCPACSSNVFCYSMLLCSSWW